MWQCWTELKVNMINPRWGLYWIDMFLFCWWIHNYPCETGILVCSCTYAYIVVNWTESNMITTVIPLIGLVWYMVPYVFVLLVDTVRIHNYLCATGELKSNMINPRWGLYWIDMFLFCWWLHNYLWTELKVIWLIPHWGLYCTLVWTELNVIWLIPPLGLILDW